MPASWHVGGCSQGVASIPDCLVLNAKAFFNPLLLTLESIRDGFGAYKEKGCELQRVRGLDSWGLFDMENGGCLINPDRDELPLKHYDLISQKETDILSHEGLYFGDDDDEGIFVRRHANELIELSDGTTCFLTRLFPAINATLRELRIKGQNGSVKEFRFKTKKEKNDN